MIGYGGIYAQIPLLLLLCACTTVPTVFARGHGYFNGIHEKTTEKVHSELLSREIRLRNRHVKLVWDQEKAWRADGESEARLDHELERIQASLNDKDGFATGLWILALKGPITHKLKERIEECLPPAIRLGSYIPDNSYAVYAPATKDFRRTLLRCPGAIYATLLLPEDKFDGDSAKALVKAAHGHAPIGLFFYIHDTIAEKERAALEGAVRNSLEALCGNDQTGMCHQAPALEKVNEELYYIEAVDSTAHRLADIVLLLANYPPITHIEPRRQVKSRNFWARSVVQTGEEERNYYWENGLYGEGQVIGLSDTGIDHDHCFFYDGNTPTPLNKVNMGHRKIVYYKTFRDGEDHKGGHGTPIAGSLAGKAICPATTQGTFECEGMQRMNGMASEAKIAFIDLQSKTDKELVLPKDMYKDVYKDLYTKTGARIHSGSWGNPAIHGYDTTAYQLDKFAYDNLDFVHIVAAGNGGEKGFETLDSPGIAKNAITVGSCRSFESSFHYVGLGLGYDVTNPPNVRGIYITSPAKIGDYFGQIVLESEVVWAEPQMACSPLTNADQASGKIIFVRRGQCEFDVKAVHVTAAGGRIMLIVNNKPGDPVVAYGDGFYNISVAMIRQDDGELLSQYIGKGLRIKFPADDMAPLNLLYSDAFMSNFSSKGPTRDGRIKPDIVAPGEYITSSESDGSTETYQCHEFNGLVSMVGTSLATPQVSAAVALIREYFMKGWYPEGKPRHKKKHIPSAALIKAIIATSGRRVYERSDGTVDWDSTLPYQQGFGRILLSEVLPLRLKTEASVESNLIIADRPHPLTTGDSVGLCFKSELMGWPFPGRLTATLAWTDPPAGLQAAHSLVNDLDLKLTHVDSGKVYLGNLLYTRDHSGKDKPVYDAQNNVERIELRENDTALQSPHRNHIAVPPEGLAGVFYLEVFGAHVPASAQKFAFVVSAKYYDIYTLDFSACANMTSRCINDCSGNGKCDTKKGRCQCKGGFGGADCGLRAVMMDVNISSSSLVGKADGLKVGDWRYFEADLADLAQDDSLPYLEVVLDMDQGSKGDPDLYINDNGELPTLLAHKFQDLTCDSCDGQQTRFRVKKSKLSSLQLVLGVYGHCCAESAFTIRFYQTTPPPVPAPPPTPPGPSPAKSTSSSSNGSMIATAVVVPVLALILFVAGLVMWRRCRRASSSQFTHNVHQSSMEFSQEIDGERDMSGIHGFASGMERYRMDDALDDVVSDDDDDDDEEEDDDDDDYQEPKPVKERKKRKKGRGMRV